MRRQFVSDTVTKGKVVLPAVVLALVFAPRLLPAPIYRATALGSLGGCCSTGKSINNSGQITGWSDTAGGETRAFLYSGGIMTDLGTLGGDYSAGASINDLTDHQAIDALCGTAAFNGTPVTVIAHT